MAKKSNYAETGNREYKSGVFSMLLEEKSYALEIYNALNHSDYKNPDEITIITAEHGVFLSIRNDASFYIDGNTNYYEHQSTYNPNMPLRFLIYFANDIEKTPEVKERLFGRRLIKIPTPHFVVFYNGVENRPESEEMKLSYAFLQQTDEPQLEVICRVYNINPGFNEELKGNSKVLGDYTRFVEKVRRYHETVELDVALKCAVEDCIEEGILAEFFRNRGSEVIQMTVLDYSTEKQVEYAREEGIEIGIEKGIEKGIEQERANTEEQRKRADNLEKQLAAVNAEKAEMAKRLKELESKS